MKRTPFAHRAPPRRESTQWVGDALPGQRGAWPESLRVADGKARLTISLPKQRPARSEAYRRWVASLACAHCNRYPPSQCAHADESKGMALKSSDANCFPLCAACHLGIGSEGWFKKEHRRTLERKYGEKTRATAKAAGTWPGEWL